MANLSNHNEVVSYLKRNENIKVFNGIDLHDKRISFIDDLSVIATLDDSNIVTVSTSFYKNAKIEQTMPNTIVQQVVISSDGSLLVLLTSLNEEASVNIYSLTVGEGPGWLTTKRVPSLNSYICLDECNKLFIADITNMRLLKMSNIVSNLTEPRIVSKIEMKCAVYDTDLADCYDCVIEVRNDICYIAGVFSTPEQATHNRSTLITGIFSLDGEKNVYEYKTLLNWMAKPEMRQSIDNDSWLVSVVDNHNPYQLRNYKKKLMVHTVVI